MSTELHFGEVVQQTSTTVGTGTITLDDTIPIHRQGFIASGIATGKTVSYFIHHQVKNEWEIGEGVITDAVQDTLSRVTVIASSNSNSLVNFSSGIKTVMNVLTARDVALARKNTQTANGAITAASVSTTYFLTAGGVYTITLPAVSGLEGVELEFVIVSGSSVVTLDGNGSETINGSATLAMAAATYDYVKIICTGSEWIVLNT
tara:strand:+ start:7026 stop:7640 length:615 start_codon:yes stop_codon:yes gene_type:complete